MVTKATHMLAIFLQNDNFYKSIKNLQFFFFQINQQKEINCNFSDDIRKYWLKTKQMCIGRKQLEKSARWRDFMQSVLVTQAAKPEPPSVKAWQ